MKMDFAGKVVAITGAASGLGCGIATRLAKAGARLSLADRHAERLSTLAEELRASGATVTTCVLDVRDDDAMRRFADQTFAEYGAVDYAIFSAGLSSMGSIFRVPVSEWQLLFDVNVMGLVHGARAFVPRMIEQDAECHVINVVSNAGLECNAFLPAYFMSKHAALSVTESLTLELQTIGSTVKVHAFCPGLVQTPLSRNAAELRGDGDPYYQSDEFKMLGELGRKALAKGMLPEEAVDGFFAGLAADHFYIRTHAGEEDQVLYRTQRVLDKQRPKPLAQR